MKTEICRCEMDLLVKTLKLVAIRDTKRVCGVDSHSVW